MRTEEEKGDETERRAVESIKRIRDKVIRVKKNRRRRRRGGCK